MVADLGQAFLWANDLKADLAQLAAHCDEHADELQRKGLIGFLSTPPAGIENRVTALWDRFLPS